MVEDGSQKDIRYTLIEICLNHTQQEETAIAIILIFVLGVFRIVLLVEVVLWWGKRSPLQQATSNRAGLRRHPHRDERPYGERLKATGC